MYCVKCGKLVDENDRFCQNCGQSLLKRNINNTNNFQNDYAKKQKEDKANVLLVIVSFLIPLVGLILYLANMNKSPKFATANGIAALIGFIVNILAIIALIGFSFYMFNDLTLYDNDGGHRYEYRHYIDDDDDDYIDDEQLDEKINDEIEEFDKKIEELFREKNNKLKKEKI